MVGKIKIPTLSTESYVRVYKSKGEINMKKILLVLLIFISIFINNCNKNNTSSHENNNLEEIYNGKINDINIDYPYLYIAGYTDGLWRVDISNENYNLTYLPVLDSSNMVTEVDYITAYEKNIIVTTYTNICKSNDGGKNWEIAEDGLGTLSYIGPITRSEQFPQKIIAFGLDSNVFYSDNNADSWTASPSFPSGFKHWVKINPYLEGDLWILAEPSGTITSGNNSFLVNSNEYGKSIKEIIDVKNLLMDDYNDWASVYEIDFDYFNKYLLVNGSCSYIFQSSHQESNWKEIYNSKTDSVFITTIFKHQELEDVFYFSVRNKVYITDDVFKSFQLIGEIPLVENLPNEEQMINRLLIDYNNNNLFIMTLGKIFVISI